MQQPRVTVGIPVYNGQNYLREAIESVLKQTYTDFELIISDNGSTDRTQEICEEYKRSDSRIRYFRSDVNRGATWNFNRVVNLARGEYFRWNAHDDTIELDYLRQCVAVLDTHPDVVLCTTQVEIINGSGESHGVYFQDGLMRTDSSHAHVRYHDLLRGHRCFEIFGLIRLDVLRRTPLLGAFGHADGVLLNHLSLLGRFYEIPKPLFAERMHSTQSINTFGSHTGKSSTADGPPDYRAYTAWYDPRKAGKIVFPYWRMLREYFLMIWRYSLPLEQRVLCLYHLAVWTRKRRYWLGQDLKVAARDVRRHLGGRLRSTAGKKKVV